jgi:sulfur carrier protein
MTAMPSNVPITIELNGQATTVVVATLAELVTHLGHGDRRIATARNGHFIPSALRATTPLEPGDRIEILSPRQGG